MSRLFCVHMGKYCCLFIRESQITWKICSGKTCFLPTVLYLAGFWELFFCCSHPLKDILWGICVPKSKRCHRGLQRRIRSRCFAAWDLGHKYRWTDRHYYISCRWILQGELISWNVMDNSWSELINSVDNGMFLICAAVEWVASGTTRLVDHWLPPK